MRILLSLLLCAVLGQLSAQYQYRFLNQWQGLQQEAQWYATDQRVHTAIRPLDQWQLDSLTAEEPLPAAPAGQGFWHWLNRKAFYEQLVKIERPDYALRIDPVVNLQAGQSKYQPFTYINTRGFLIEGHIGKKLTFYSSFLESQGRFAEYFDREVRLREVVPGQSSKVRSFGEGGHDYGLASGEVTYTPNRFFSFTAGQGRNFFGEGYRSLLLSDAGYNYPFFRIQTKFWRIKYVNLWAQLYDIRPEASRQTGNGGFAKKYLSSHYLSINISSRWNLAFFEAIVTGDTLQQQGLDASFLNPVIFYRPVEFSVGSRTGNALMGAQLSYKIEDGMQAYGQFILDEFSIEDLQASNGSWVNKFGWQLGIKDYATLGVEGLFSRLEYNAIRPYTYSHRNVLTNYGHYNQGLAHPYGANFHEFIAQAVYQRGRWEGELQVNYARRGLDPAGANYGGDIFKPYGTRERELGNDIAQGLTANYWYSHLRLAYVLNPASGLKLEAGLRSRRLSGAGSEDLAEWWGFWGLRTALFNRYYDY